MRQNNTSRPAFTLVELLVAAGIIALLLGLVAISYPSINEREQLTRAVDKLRTGYNWYSLEQRC
jgi:prepilin-type N-terminal cleavage/methylation domain-containing protein